MINEIKKFKDNAVAIELLETFTEADATLIKQLFEEKLDKGFTHINLLIKVKDMSLIKNINLKGFLEGKLWAVNHFGKIGRLAVVSHSNFIEEAVKIESKVLPLFNSALDEKYFDHTQLDEALIFISPNE